MKTSTRLLSILGLFTVTHLFAQSVPEYVNYQGLLKAADGSPLATGNYTIEFNTYDQANGGTKVWGPFLFDGGPGNGHGALVPVVNGSFNVIIGPNDTDGDSIADAFNGPNRFIEIKVNGGAPILPRQQFLSTAYAMQSQNAQFAPLAQMAVQASNLVQQAADALCPPGSIMAFGGTVVPAGWLLCDGSALSNAVFPRLYAGIGTAWGDGTYHRGNLESPANPDTVFNLPDLRGMFLRGMSGAGAMDPDRTNRVALVTGGASGNAVGSYQTDEFRLHNHTNGTFNILLRNDGTQRAANVTDGNAPNVWNYNFIKAVGGAETRPKNAYVNYIIKY